MKNFDQKISNKLATIDKLIYTFDEETISVIFELAKAIKRNGSVRTIDEIINHTFQGYASQLCVGKTLKEFGEVDQPSVQYAYNEWKSRETRNGDFRFFNGEKMQIKSMASYDKDISMSFDQEYKYREIEATCDENNPKYSKYVLITRCMPLIARKKYLVSASALLLTNGLLRFIEKYPGFNGYKSKYHLQTAKLYCRGGLEWYDKYSPPCDEDGNYKSDFGVTIKRYTPKEESVDLMDFCS